ncbi:hypothetical protein [Halobellus salinisoli]|uniref:hypothetical protein n=1 Tax=Halobellus salinisoli TaxID=3108500 RepID=UPI00300BEB37
MGNLLIAAFERPIAMSADRPRLGVDHPTVVPRPPRETDDAEASTDEAVLPADDAAHWRSKSGNA